MSLPSECWWTGPPSAVRSLEQLGWVFSPPARGRLPIASLSLSSRLVSVVASSFCVFFFPRLSASLDFSFAVDSNVYQSCKQHARVYHPPILTFFLGHLNCSFALWFFDLFSVFILAPQSHSSGRVFYPYVPPPFFLSPRAVILRATLSVPPSLTSLSILKFSCLLKSSPVPTRDPPPSPLFSFHFLRGFFARGVLHICVRMF